MGFNTASVLIQQRSNHGCKKNSRVSIQLLFLFNEMLEDLICSSNCFNTASVLIQPDEKSKVLCFNKFQYSFCSYSTYKSDSDVPRSVVSIQLLFLFNFSPIHSESLMMTFQYSFCSYSTVHSLTLGYRVVCFNTASVLIQQWRSLALSSY